MAPQLRLYCCPLAAVAPPQRDAYRDLLNAAERERLAGLRVEAVRTTFLVSRALLRTVLAAQVGCAPDDLQFTRDHNDKPLLGAPASPWQFNLSHSGDWVVLALCDAGAVGVDVENHQRRNNLTGIAERFFTPAENRALATLDEAAWVQRFFELWTLKEAYVKALGRGIATALAGTDIDYTDPATVRLRLSGEARCAGPVHCWHFQLTPDYSLAAAVIGSAVPEPQIVQGTPLGGGFAPLPLAAHPSGGAPAP